MSPLNFEVDYKIIRNLNYKIICNLEYKLIHNLNYKIIRTSGVKPLESQNKIYLRLLLPCRASILVFAFLSDPKK